MNASLKIMLFAVALLAGLLAYIEHRISASDNRGEGVVVSGSDQIGQVPNDIEYLRNLQSQVGEVQQLLGSLIENQHEIEENILSLHALDNESDKVPAINKLPRDPDQERREFIEKRAVQKGEFDNVIDSSGGDISDWGGVVSSKINDLFIDVPAFSVASDARADCSSSLCRVDYYIPQQLGSSEQTMLDFELTSQLGEDFTDSTIFTENMPDGRIKKTYYLARKGYQLDGSQVEPDDGNDR